MASVKKQITPLCLKVAVNAIVVQNGINRVIALLLLPSHFVFPPHPFFRCCSVFWAQRLFNCTLKTQSLVQDQPEKHSQELGEQKLHVNCNH